MTRKAQLGAPSEILRMLVHGARAQGIPDEEAAFKRPRASAAVRRRRQAVKQARKHNRRRK